MKPLLRAELKIERLERYGLLAEDQFHDPEDLRMQVKVKRCSGMRMQVCDAVPDVAVGFLDITK